ncbi:MAG: TolC family protein [Endomicrobium sp.]|jgi:adhesin transport system outer membrane protein|nr:TolC family protein [Endomicrobium sp.]
MKRFFIVLLSVSFASSYLYAEKINREIVKMQTLKNNPLITIAKLKLDNAQQEYNDSLSVFFPTIAFKGQTGQSEQYSSNRGSDGKIYSFRTDTRFSFCELTASLQVFSGFVTSNNLKSKVAKIKFAQAEYDKIVSSVVYTSDLAYINLMWAYERVELLKEIKERRVENKDIVKLQYNSGKADMASLKIVEADVAVVECNLKQAQRRIKVASMFLLNAIGRNDDATILEVDEKLVSFEELIQKPDYNNLITTIPEFLQKQYQFDIYKAEMSKTKGEYLLPKLDLFGTISPYNKKSISGETISTSDKQVFLQLSYSFFTGGKIRAAIKMALNNIAIASEELKKEVNSLKTQAVQHYTNIIDSYELTKANIQSLNALKLQAEMASIQYINGLINYSDWYRIGNDYINLQIKNLDDKKNLAEFKAKWLNFMGKGF